MMKLIGFAEKILAYVQGKGFGANNIINEVRQTLRFTKNNLKLVIDVGGNIGNYSQELLRKSPNLEIHIFEPSMVNIKKLNQAFCNYPNVMVQPFALSDEMGEGLLYSDMLGSGLGSLTKRNIIHLNIDFEDSEKITKMRFEDYWYNVLDSRPIDLVKIDIEGHELSALKGFGAAIEAIRVIQFEFGGCNIDTRTYFQDFWYYFQEKGYDIHRITPFGTTMLNQYSEMDECFRTTNYLAVRRS
jgi:FkbM family methyltransferase